MMAVEVWEELCGSLCANIAHTKYQQLPFFFSFLECGNSGRDFSKMKHYRDFLGSPVVKNPVPPLKGAWVLSVVGDLISCILCSQKKKNYDHYSEVVHIEKETRVGWISILAAPAWLLGQPDGKKKKKKRGPLVIGNIHDIFVVMIFCLCYLAVVEM